ncbi:MAG TPA: hypothetical protein VJ841_01080 [Candidatus Saccharimonadales bacterium]|nr:hypothetical protein [Candidatus Saccharimonadales bacterium]
MNEVSLPDAFQDVLRKLANQMLGYGSVSVGTEAGREENLYALCMLYRDELVAALAAEVQKLRTERTVRRIEAGLLGPVPEKVFILDVAVCPTSFVSETIKGPHPDVRMYRLVVHSGINFPIEAVIMR